MKSSMVGGRQAEVLDNLIQREHEHLYAAAAKHINRTGPESKDVHEDIKEELMHILAAAWEESFKYMSTLQARQLAHLGKERHDSSDDLTYGEVNFSSLAQILCEDLRRYGIPLQGTFYDLGSGSGRGVLVAALVGSFQRICGVEIVPELHKASMDVLHAYKSRVALKYSVPIPDKLEFVQANITKADWSDANVIFINSTCFSKPLMEKIAKKAESLAPGSCVVTLTQPIISPYFDLLESKKYAMSWGTATAHIHVRSEKASSISESKARYWSKKIPGKKDYGALFDGYTSA